MVREIVTLSIGECGVNLGANIYEKYSAEHKMSPKGTDNSNPFHNSNPFYYSPSYASDYQTQNHILCDSSLYNKDISSVTKYHRSIQFEDIIAPKEDCGNNFAQGFYTIGKECIDNLYFYRVRRHVDGCDNVQGFVLNHSITGGTGSGLTALLLEKLSVDYRKKVRFAFEICPFEESNCVIDPYNMAFAIHNIIDYTDLSLMFDNQRLYNLCKDKLNINEPSYHNLNELICKTATHFTQNLRFNAFNANMNDIYTHSVPFPRLHFLTPSIAAIIPKYSPLMLIDGYVRSIMPREVIYNDIMNLLYKSYNVNVIQTDPINLTKYLFDSSNFLMEYTDFDARQGKSMSTCMNFRTRNNSISEKDIAGIYSDLKKEQYFDTIEWVPKGNMCSIIDQQKIGNEEELKGDCFLAETDNSAVMIGNNTAFGAWVTKRVLNKFNAMFDRRAYIHWFRYDGMEMDYFLETREDLEFLKQDYCDVVKEVTDEGESEEDLNYSENNFVIPAMSEQQMIEKALEESLGDWKRNIASNHAI